MTREEVLEKYVSPTMTLEQAVRWIRFGLPPLQTSGLERMYLYDDVILREFEDIPTPEHIDPRPHYQDEKAILVQALHKGDFVAWGIRDEINWDGFLESVGIQWFRYPPRPGEWFPMPAEMWKWSNEFNLTQSRVSFHDAEYFCGPDWCQDIYVYTEDMMRIFPRENCQLCEYIKPENDVFHDVEDIDKNLRELKEEPKTSHRRRGPRLRTY